MHTRKKLSAIAVASVLGLTLVACSSDSGDTSSSDEGGSGDTTLTFWHYEGDDSAMTKSWNAAIEEFEADNPGVTIEVEKQTFEQLQKNAKIVLAGDDVPDIMEYNKGNGTAGQLAAQGLLTDLTADADSFGWSDLLPSSLQTTARYDENGLMGSGNWYGVPTYGEYVTVYYNEDMFAENGIEVPSTLADLESAMDAFVAAGITPLAEAGAEYPIGQLWYQLVLANADRSFVDAFQLFDGEVDFSSGPLLEGTQTLADWVDKGYIADTSSGLTAEDMGVSFIAGDYPIMISGSWWFGRLNTEVQFTLGQMLFPGNELNTGSSGNLLVVPTNSDNAALAAEFLNTALGETAQNVAAEEGGLPVAGDASVIEDPETQTLQENFDQVVADDGLSYYPDWPVAGFYDQIVSFGQSIINGSQPPEDALASLGEYYQEGRADLLGE